MDNEFSAGQDMKFVFWGLAVLTIPIWLPGLFLLLYLF